MAIFGIFVAKRSIENLGSVLLALKPAQDIKQKKEAPRGKTPLVGVFSGGDQSSAISNEDSGLSMSGALLIAQHSLLSPVSSCPFKVKAET